MQNQTYFLIIVVILVLSGGLLIKRLSENLNFNSYVQQTQAAINNIGNLLDVLTTSRTTPEPEIISTPEPLATPKNKPTYKPVNDIKKDEVNLKKPKQPLVVNTCLGFTVPHLDGSSSTLCYSQSDYNQLSSLLSQFNQAKSNLSYEERVLRMYQDAQKTSFDPSFYQKYIDEASRKAQEYKDKIGQISLQMYNIESRGK